MQTNGEKQAEHLESLASQMVDSTGVPVFGVLDMKADYFGVPRFISGYKSLACNEALLLH